MKSTGMASLAIPLLCLLLPAACSPAKTDAPATATDQSALEVPEPVKAPAIEQFYVPVLQRLDGDLKKLVQSGKVANVSYALIKDDEWVQTGFHGTRTLGGDEPVDAHTIYRIYSMTKAVTAVSLLMLYEEGEFSMDDPITRFLPELDHLTVQRSFGATDGAGVHPASRPPTMYELLTHTAGFAYDDGQPDYAHRMFIERQVNAAATGKEYVRRIASVPLMYEPGTAWSYSAASDLQGIIVERITGERLGTFMKERIFDPLGMPDTGFSVDEAQRPRLADFTRWTPDQPIRRAEGPMVRMDAAQLPRDAGGHGLVSTLADYARFAEMLLHEGTLDGVTLLKPETVEMMRTNALHFTDPETGHPDYEPSRGTGFGFGVGVVTNTIRSGLAAPEGTFFWDGASGTWFWVDPRHDIVFIGLIQNASPIPLSARRMSMQHVYHALFTDYFPVNPDAEDTSLN